MDPLSWLDAIALLDNLVQSGAGTSPYAVLGFMVLSSLSILTTR